MSAPHTERIRELKLEILRVIESKQHSPAEGYCACWAAFVRITALTYGEGVACQVRDAIKAASQQKQLELLSSLPPVGEA